MNEKVVPVPQYPRSDYGYAVMPPVPERALYFIDSEFIENGTTIDIISTAIVSGDGRKLYFQNIDCKFDKASRARQR